MNTKTAGKSVFYLRRTSRCAILSSSSITFQRCAQMQQRRYETTRFVAVSAAHSSTTNCSTCNIVNTLSTLTDNSNRIITAISTCFSLQNRDATLNTSHATLVDAICDSHQFHGWIYSTRSSHICPFPWNLPSFNFTLWIGTLTF
jgi:hypothetical protein